MFVKIDPSFDRRCKLLWMESARFEASYHHWSKPGQLIGLSWLPDDTRLVGSSCHQDFERDIVVLKIHSSEFDLVPAGQEFGEIIFPGEYLCVGGPVNGARVFNSHGSKRVNIPLVGGGVLKYDMSRGVLKYAGEVKADEPPEQVEAKGLNKPSSCHGVSPVEAAKQWLEIHDMMEAALMKLAGVLLKVKEELGLEEA